LNIGNTTCPVCKAGVSRENVIPLFIRGCEEDPRFVPSLSSADFKRLKTKSEVPNRPTAQRPTPGPSGTQQVDENSNDDLIFFLRDSNKE
jgi:hypothetical protein